MSTLCACSTSLGVCIARETKRVRLHVNQMGACEMCSVEIHRETWTVSIAQQCLVGDIGFC